MGTMIADASHHAEPHDSAAALSMFVITEQGKRDGNCEHNPVIVMDRSCRSRLISLCRLQTALPAKEKTHNHHNATRVEIWKETTSFLR